MDPLIALVTPHPRFGDRVAPPPGFEGFNSSYETGANSPGSLDPLLTYQWPESTEAAVTLLELIGSFSLWTQLVNLQQRLDSMTDGQKRDFDRLRDKANPATPLAGFRKPSRNVAKLANLDFVAHLTDISGVSENIWSLLRPSSPDPFTYCDLAGGPGAFTAYLQLRFPAGRGWGISLRDPLTPAFNWNPAYLSGGQFTIVEQPRGDLFQEYPIFIATVLAANPTGVDLVVADGGIDIEGSTEPDRFNREEELSMPLLFVQTYVAIKTNKLGGNICVKVKHTLTAASAQLIAQVAQNYDRVILIKPFTSRPANSERYLIGLDKQNEDGLDRLAVQLRTLAPAKVATNLDLTIPVSLRDWLIRSNDFALTQQIAAFQRIEQYQATKNPVVTINTEYARALLALPEN